MTKKLIFLNVLIVSLIVLSACGSTINVQVPEAAGTAPSVSIANPTTAAPAQTGFSNNTLIYVIIGLVGVVLLIAVIAVIGSRNKNQ